MKGRATVSLLTTSQADADTLRGDLQQWLDGRSDRSGFEAQNPVVLPRKAGSGFAVVGSLVFEARLGADALLAQLESRWTSGPLSARFLSGSSVALHECRHDEDVGACINYTVSVKP